MIKRIVNAVADVAVQLMGLGPEALSLGSPLGAFIFFASVMYHVSRATPGPSGRSPPGAFGNGSGAWRGGGRTVFVPALNGAHGHGFMSAGLTGFALQGHEAGVEAGQEHIIHSSEIFVCHPSDCAFSEGGFTNAVPESVRGSSGGRKTPSEYTILVPVKDAEGRQVAGVAIDDPVWEQTSVNRRARDRVAEWLFSRITKGPLGNLPEFQRGSQHRQQVNRYEVYTEIREAFVIDGHILHERVLDRSPPLRQVWARPRGGGGVWTGSVYRPCWVGVCTETYW